MATKKTATQKVMSKEESLFEEEKAVKTSKSSAKKPVEKALKVTKKATKKAEKVEEPKAEEPKVEQPKVEEPKAEPKKEVKNTATAPVKKTTVKKAEKKENPMDRMFPKTIEVDGTTFERHEELTSWEDFKAFTEKNFSTGIHTVVACNWPKKHKKEYDANNYGEKLFPKDGFEHDLDLQEVLMLQQTRETAITVSILTESVILFREDYFELTDFGYFLENGMPFMVYTYEDAE